MLETLATSGPVDLVYVAICPAPLHFASSVLRCLCMFLSTGGHDTRMHDTSYSFAALTDPRPWPEFQARLLLKELQSMEPDRKRERLSSHRHLHILSNTVTLPV